MPPTNTLDNIIVRPKRFQCPRCQRRFARLEHLQRHERTHTRERPFPCKRCESRFTRSDLLIRHMRLSHGTPGEVLHLNQGLGELSSSGRGREPSLPGTSTLPSQEPIEDEGPGTTAAPHPVFACASPKGVATDVMRVLTGTGGETHPAPVLHSPSDPTVLQTAALWSLDALAQPSLPQMTTPPLHLNSEETLGDFAEYLETDVLTSYRVPSPGSAAQLDLAFTLGHFMDPGDIPFIPQAEFSYGQSPPRKADSLSQFCSRLPSAQAANDPTPERILAASSNGSESHGKIFDVTSEARERIIRKTSEFITVVPRFQLPSRLSLARYLRGYVEGFHVHLPFLHVQSMSIQTCSVELLLAMAAVGAQYCFESDKGLSLFHAARSIANERIRRRDAGLATSTQNSSVSTSSASLTGSTDNSPTTINGALGIPHRTKGSASGDPSHELIQTAQALLILMAMATWGKHGELLREALAIQSILASIIRDDGLRMQPPTEPGAGEWEAEMMYESVLRTKYIVFCFFNLHCIFYDIPPLILSSELQMRLPCSTAEFRAGTAAAWQEAKVAAGETSRFQDATRRLFSRHGYGGDTVTQHSSLANYVLIHAIIQHIFFVRQTARCRVDLQDSGPAEDDTAALKSALRNWQLSWEYSPESSLDPASSFGPVAFNSTALLRLAYVRLSMDTGPCRTLGTRDPLQIAHALRDIPALPWSNELNAALLHSAHALSIPIKIGIQLVARTQTFLWSIQHSLSSLECALLLSKWLEAVVISQNASPNDVPTTDERRTLALVMEMLNETEFAVPEGVSLGVSDTARYLNIGMLKVWATVFKGSQTWAIVDVIGSALDLYANMLQGAN
ncbi:hypothetical protein C8A01DRAFT_17088 [Parachaetomium inaequale]|uniref:C2H2-type domain-containing protein n=1 Tax=Parachaetomium inaequale TaxID=2588326 RepID=A0AAN6SQZ7_9PEZI|nr:hypothetical protein C8A01DRAFT_17088 [Parachaetomium inaequale]